MKDFGFTLKKINEGYQSLAINSQLLDVPQLQLTVASKRNLKEKKPLIGNVY